MKWESIADILRAKKEAGSVDNNGITPLPPDVDLETKQVLKKLSSAHRALAELKGFAETMPEFEKYQVPY